MFDIFSQNSSLCVYYSSELLAPKQNQDQIATNRYTVLRSRATSDIVHNTQDNSLTNCNMLIVLQIYSKEKDIAAIKPDKLMAQLEVKNQKYCYD